MDRDILRSDQYDLHRDQPNTIQTANKSTSDSPTNISFDGNIQAYTLQWLINAFLSFITAGLYLPWARASNLRYLYQHTHIDGHPLKYHATPLKVFGTNLALIVMLLLIAVFINLPSSRIFTIASLLALIPWMINYTIHQRLSMTSYRGKFFSFHGNIFDTAVNFFLVPLLAVLVMGFFIPFWLYRLHKYVIESSRFDDQRITLDVDSGSYLRMIGGGVILGALFLMLLNLGLAVIAMGLEFVLQGIELEDSYVIMLTFGAALILSGYFAIGFIQSYLQNHIVNALQIGQHIRFESTIQRNAFIRLMLGNGMLMVVTLGLAYPATQIRKRRFLAASTRVYYGSNSDVTAES